MKLDGIDLTSDETAVLHRMLDEAEASFAVASESYASSPAEEAAFESLLGKVRAAMAVR
jgi:hypothetical protein